MENLDYGIIGNCRSAALISKSGSIDWCCLPTFDAPSIFAKLLDKNIGGSFSIEVGPEYKIQQRYHGDTSILLTTFDNGTDMFEMRDFMPRYMMESGESFSPPEIIRFFKIVRGRPVFKVTYDPKLEYAAEPTESYVKKSFIISLTQTKRFNSVFLYSSFDLQAIFDSTEIALEGDGYMLMSYNEKVLKPTLSQVALEMERTKVYWLNWSAKTPTYSRYDQYIRRSAITLKLLSYEKTGAILAAATTSLPETIGEVRNWDYRFCWIRDASMVVSVLNKLGHRTQAQSYVRFILSLLPDKDQKLQIMYGIDGQKKLTEEFLEHLSGYEDSKPVRIGNAAYIQRQHDIYGVLMDVLFQQLQHFCNDTGMAEDIWNVTKGIVWVVQRHWEEPDKGIWEFRTEERHFTFSKVLCWVAVDRAVKVAHMLGKLDKAQKWEELARSIHSQVLSMAWSDKVGAFTQSYNSEDLDASVLLMETYGFIEAHDPRFIATVKAIGTDLSRDGLLYRYKNRDDFGLPSSSFTICTFWYINALVRIGEVEQAETLFIRLLSYSNHLGLFSEDIDFATKRLLGNFPQAYSHLALIETAISFSSVTREGRILENLG
jgi:GH15 family glucan-1,4-alpha-glucosidase